MQLHGGLICITFCLSVCLCEKLLEKITRKNHNSGNIASSTVKFGQDMNMDNLQNDLEGQRSRSPGKKFFFMLHEEIDVTKRPKVTGSRSPGSRSKVRLSRLNFSG